ncbi:lysophospholipid acyltransferase family protein [Micromonospora sp. SH-82]|uniref:lysophospholipid acyltransferase family protein n=1 Tax=Micromonospora sp. SH-82 TaxID=3132938 RepID=UPI003EB98BD0
MPELVYPPVIAAARTMFRVLDLRLTVEGSHHVPRTGGAVMASNHIGYLDFIFCGLGALESRRLVRFMAKQEVFNHRISGPLMRAMKHISVDRQAGSASFRAAVEALRAGEVVGVFPEGTVSRSLTVKELKSGTVRMARMAGVPVLPTALWGTQRLWTKGRPRTLTRRHLPVTILVGEPMDPADYPNSPAMATALTERLHALVERAQREYPEKPSEPDETWWQPAHLGGTAPTPEEAAVIDAATGTDRSPTT